MSSEPPESGGDTVQDVEGRMNKGVDDIVTDDIRDAQDAAQLLGIDITADDEEIDSAFRRLATILHPDTGGTDEAFRALDKATNYLKEYVGEEAARETVREAKRQDAPRSPGEPFDRGERQEQYETTHEAIKLHFIQEISGKNLEPYDTVNAALGAEAITRGDIQKVNNVLRREYGIPDLTLEDISRVLSSLIVSGSITLGNVEFMAEEAGVFKRSSRRSGGGTGVFGGSRKSGGGTGPFSR